MHPIAEDPHELAAALHASDRILAQYPYLFLRFGERGRRFADSDSTWLATLVRRPQQRVDTQTAWIAAVEGALAQAHASLKRFKNNRNT
ncbi:MAG: hypothetical protein EOM22_12440 [Gammaproteobacteria bacterium]|nr:hypothetical protein [Gammaproteobacteria bacterium]